MLGKQSLQANTREYAHSIQGKEAECEGIRGKSALTHTLCMHFQILTQKGKGVLFFICENTFPVSAVFLSLHCNHISVDPQTPQYKCNHSIFCYRTSISLIKLSSVAEVDR